MRVRAVGLILLLLAGTLTLLGAGAVTPDGWTQFNELPSDNTWTQANQVMTFVGDGTASATFSYLINDTLSLGDFRYNGRLSGLDDGTDTVVGIVARWADVDNYTAFYLFEGDGGEARIVRSTPTGVTIQHSLSISWTNNFEFQVEVLVFNDTMIVTVTDAAAITHTLAASIPTEQLGNTQVGLIGYPIFASGEARWEGLDFTTYTNPKDVVIHDTSNHAAFPGIYYARNEIHVTYREGSVHGLDLNARIMETVSADKGATWSTPTVWLDIASKDEREVSFLTLANGTILAVTNDVGPTTATQDAVVLWSTDTGISWTVPQQIGDFLGETEERSAGHPLQLANGTILMPLYDIGFAPVIPSWIVWSDDMVTWTVLGQLGGAPQSEWAVTEMGNGTLWANVRATTSRWDRTFSTDGGASWLPTVNWALPELYNGVSSWPSIHTLPSGNFILGNRMQLEATVAGERSRFSGIIYGRDGLLDPRAVVVLDAYDREGEVQGDDYGTVAYVSLPNSEHYVVWYDQSTQSVEGRLLVEGDFITWGTSGRTGPFTLSLTQEVLAWNQVRIMVRTDCEDCVFLWDMGDGSLIRTLNASVLHTYEPPGVWAYYGIRLLTCRPLGSICETRNLSVLVVNWTMVGVLIGVPLVIAIVLGRRRIRGRVLEVAK